MVVRLRSGNRSRYSIPSRRSVSCCRHRASSPVQVTAPELLIAILTGSVRMLGDAIHNLSDVSASAVVFFEFWVSRRGPTVRYTYGLERAEFKDASRQGSFERAT